MKNTHQTSSWKVPIYKITNRVNRILHQLFENINPSQKEIWELQYVKGDWDYLKNLEQLGHYSIIIGYYYELKRGDSILDVGCGEGIIQEKIGEDNYLRYIGIDISDNAIKQAMKKNSDITRFLTSDALSYETNLTFDVIIFNEILYYFSREKITELLKKYDKILDNDGIIIVSMYLNEENELIWKLIQTYFALIDETKITNKNGASWKCKVFRKVNE